jgi:hypothetical protein
MRPLIVGILTLLSLISSAEAQWDTGCLTPTELSQWKEGNQKILQLYGYEDLRNYAGKLPALAEDMVSRQKAYDKCMDGRDIIDNIIDLSCQSESSSYNRAVEAFNQVNSIVKQRYDMILAQMRLNRNLFHSCSR